MTDKHLRFLDFLLPILSSKYPNGESLSYLADDFSEKLGEEFSYEERKHFQESYKDEFFRIEGNLDKAIIIEEIKEIIDTYGSLTSFFKKKINKNQEQLGKEIL